MKSLFTKSPQGQKETPARPENQIDQQSMSSIPLGSISNTDSKHA